MTLKHKFLSLKSQNNNIGEKNRKLKKKKLKTKI